MSLMEIVIDIVAIYTQVFAIMDPIGVIPIYIGLSEEIDEDERRRLIKHIFNVSLALIAIFTIGGKWILDFFGISIPAVRFGGGILLMAIAIDMLGGLPKAKQVRSEEIATVPLATPLLVGPGTITTLILLVTRYNVIEVLIGASAVVLTTYIILLYADKLVSFLGEGFIRTLGRIMAVIVAAIASEMIYYAIKDWFIRLVL